MTEPILFPDAAAAVCEFLATALGVPTSNAVPNPRPAQFYRVRRLGGASRDLVMDDATIVVEAWAATDDEADDLAQLARAHLLAIRGTHVDDALLYRALDFAGPANDPDPVSGSPRSTATYQVTVRGVALDAAS